MASARRPPSSRGRRALTLRCQRVSRGYAVVLGERLPRSFGATWGHPTPATVVALPRWRPRADVTETAGSIVITVELAGVDPDEVEVVRRQFGRPSGPLVRPEIRLDRRESWLATKDSILASPISRTRHDGGATPQQIGHSPECPRAGRSGRRACLRTRLSMWDCRSDPQHEHGLSGDPSQRRDLSTSGGDPVFGAKRPQVSKRVRT
jgi:hypothetical protein